MANLEIYPKQGEWEEADKPGDLSEKGTSRSIFFQ
jgi:hypothetical protein